MAAVGQGTAGIPGGWGWDRGEEREGTRGGDKGRGRGQGEGEGEGTRGGEGDKGRGRGRGQGEGEGTRGGGGGGCHMCSLREFITPVQYCGISKS